MTNISHERCSELLRPFLYDELGEADAAAVRQHLATCDECSQERDAIATLLGPQDEQLSELESARLRARVRQALAPPTRAGFSRTYRFAQALGVAALLIGGAALAYTAVTGTFGRDDGPQLGAGGGVADKATARIVEGLPVRIPAAAGTALEAQADAAHPRRAPKTERNRGMARGTTGGDKGGVAAESETFDSAARAPEPKPIYAVDVPPVTERDLTTVGRYGTSLLSFARAYKAADAEELQIEFLQLLANATGAEERSDQVTKCGMSVLARPYPTLPAIAFFTERDETEILVLAFAWADHPDGRLDRFMVWSWRDGDCDSVPDYRSGRINS
jgi:hypothetical protein